VQNLLLFRFTTTFLEPIWNRHYVDAVQIPRRARQAPPRAHDLGADRTAWAIVEPSLGNATPVHAYGPPDAAQLTWIFIPPLRRTSRCERCRPAPRPFSA